jgi:hypothetical protein
MRKGDARSHCGIRDEALVRACALEYRQHNRSFPLWQWSTLSGRPHTAHQRRFTDLLRTPGNLSSVDEQAGFPPDW